MPETLIIVGIVVVVLLIAVMMYNHIVQLNNRCDNAWQTIDTQLQRRNDLIPNLVETVKAMQLTNQRHLKTLLPRAQLLTAQLLP